jgi:CRP/FNR family transcriptional regulator
MAVRLAYQDRGAARPIHPAVALSIPSGAIPRGRTPGLSLVPRATDPADPLDGISTVARFDRDAAVFHQGEDADAVYRLVEGVVRLFKLLPDGRRQIVGFVQAGDLFGLPLGERRALSAEAVTAIAVRRIPRARLLALMEEDPALRLRLLGVAAEALAAAQDQMLLLGRKNAQEKICSFLGGLSRRRAAQGKDPVRLYVPMSRTDIADFLGLTIETVSRTITKLKTSGLIRMLDGNKIELLDPAALAALAEGN